VGIDDRSPGGHVRAGRFLDEMPRADENVATSTAGVDDVLVTMD
jgi:hypothetical protein